MKIRVHGDAAGNPGTVLVTDTLLISDMDEGYYNEFDFTNPVTVTGNFWVSFEVFYGAPQDSISLMCVDYNDRINGLNTMKTFYSGTWHVPADIFGTTFKSSLWLDVLTSNGPAPIADFSFSDDLVCTGGQITVNGSSSQNTTNYYWYVTDDPFTTVLNESNTAGNNFTFSQVANRRIYLFADGSCLTDGIYLPVTVKALPAATVNQTHTTCGQNNGTITITNPTGGDSPNYTYSIDGVNFQSSGVFTNLAPGNYIVTVLTPGDNCDKTYARTINNSSELTATVSSSTTICPGESAQLIASGGTAYTWYDGTTVIGNTATINVNPTATNQYSCVVSDGTCQATVYNYVYVDACGSLEEYIKQVKISPNPTQQEFKIELPGKFEFQLLDARGRLVREGSALNNTTVNVSPFEYGIYILKLKNKEFEHSFKIMKK
jgi:hypothetical protein